MTAKVTRTTIESSPYDNVYTIMNNRDNIADPRGSSAEKRAFIHDSDPMVKSMDFSGYPYIVLELPTLEYSRESVDASKKFIAWKHMITIRTGKDGGSGNTTDIGRTDMLSICDDLNKTFNSKSIKQEMFDLGMRQIKLTKIDTDTLVLNQRHVYEARYELTYEIRLEVDE